MRTLLSLLALVSASTIAGVSTISLGNGSPNISSSTVKPNSIIKDGYEYDWDNLATNDVKTITVSDLGIEFKTVTDYNETYWGSNLIRSESSAFMLKIRKNETFRLDHAIVVVKYKNKNGEYYRNPINNSIEITNTKIKRFKHKMPMFQRPAFVKEKKNGDGYSYLEMIELEKGYRVDDNYEYIEFSVLQTSIPQGYTPAVTLLAANEYNHTKHQVIAQSAICDPGCPTPDNWRQPEPMSVQLGINVQVPYASASFSVTTNFSEVEPSASVGGSFTNADVEMEAYAAFYNSDDLDAIMYGPSIVSTFDVNPVVGLGGILMSSSDLSIQGIGVTLGLTGIPDVDITGSAGFEPTPSDDNNDSNDSSDNHNPNFGGDGDTQNGNDNESGHSGGVNENSDGGVGVNSPWGGR